MQSATVQLTSVEIFQALNAFEAQEEKGSLDPALQDLREKLNEALPFSAPFSESVPE